MLKFFEHFAHNKYSNAITDFNKAIDLEPELDNNYYGRAHARWESGNRSGALSDMSKAIKLDSLNTSYLIYRGLIFQNMGAQ